MRCFQIDFQEGNILNPSHSFQLNASYVLSDCTVYTGHTVNMLFFAERISGVSLIRKVNVVGRFLHHIPELAQIFDNYLNGHKEYSKMKNIPKTVLVAKKKFDMAMDSIIKDWIDWFGISIKENGFFALRNNSELGVLAFIFHSQAEKDVAVKLGQDPELCLRDLFTFKGIKDYENKTIWLLSSGFYSEKYVDNDLITNIDTIENGKPYLINCLKMPNLNLLSSKEIKIIKTHVNTIIATFRAATDEWATECYTKKNGVTYFTEKLMPLMPTVQEAIDNDPMLKQWSRLDGLKNNSTIYFGEITPLMLWKYYKENLVMTEDSYKLILDEYEQIENHTVPVMVFAYKSDELRWNEVEVENEIQQTMVSSVKKYIEV